MRRLDIGKGGSSWSERRSDAENRLDEWVGTSGPIVFGPLVLLIAIGIIVWIVAGL